jgi:hypothetical protein
VKRPSYLARLADQAKEQQPALRPPPAIFRPSATDSSGFTESVSESRPARSGAARRDSDFAGAEHTSTAGPAVLPPRPVRSSGAASATSAEANLREKPRSLSPTRVEAESRASLRSMDRNEQPRAAVPPAAPEPDTSASKTPPPKLPAPDRAESRDDSHRLKKTAAPTTLSPKLRGDRATASSTSSDRKNAGSDGGVSVRIGTLEVRINPTPAPASLQAAAAPRAPMQSRKTSLARGFGSFGMVQG